MSKPTEPLRIDFGGERSAQRPDGCGGAFLEINRGTLDALRRSGVYFASTDEHTQGLVHARVSCRGTIETRITPTGPVTYGLCASCSGLEDDVRRERRERIQQRSNGRAA